MSFDLTKPSLKLAGTAQGNHVEMRLSEVISALSYALDLTGGNPQGHASRTCLLGMQIAKQLHLNVDISSALFYALLLKDLGCSTNASRMCYLFGADERHVKAEMKTVNWTDKLTAIKAIARLALPNAPMTSRIGRIIRTALKAPQASREMIELRCERGAKIAHDLLLPDATAQAIRSLDEHWDGSGHPDGLWRHEIPLLSRIIGLAQTIEVFASRNGIASAYEMAQQRSGTWFDPTLVRAMKAFRDDDQFWKTFNGSDPKQMAATLEPEELMIRADGDALDRIAHGFALVIDAKSPWTFLHSEGVSTIATGIATVMDLDAAVTRDIRRSGLLHDVGKLGVSNLILDKPGKLDANEIAEMRKHTDYTYRILSGVEGFRHLAANAAAHHERLDGKGYHRGLTAEQLPISARILAVADMYEALSARRPYRQDMTSEQVHSILQKNSGSGLCPVVLSALDAYLNNGGFVPVPIAA